jgi:hypothetical protein
MMSEAIWLGVEAQQVIANEACEDRFRWRGSKQKSLHDNREIAAAAEATVTPGFGALDARLCADNERRQELPLPRELSGPAFAITSDTKILCSDHARKFGAHRAAR